MTEPTLEFLDKWAAELFKDDLISYPFEKDDKLFRSYVKLGHNAAEFYDPWLPTRRVEQAWECLEKYKWAEPCINYSDEFHGWRVSFSKGRLHFISSVVYDSAPEAIMRALWSAMK